MKGEEVQERGAGVLLRGRRQVGAGLDELPPVPLELGQPHVAVEGEGAVVLGEEQRRALDVLCGEGCGGR